MGGVIRGGVLAGLAVALVTVSVPVSAAPAGRAAAAPASWRIQHVPDPAVAQGRLTGVSCASASSCTAVGFYGNVPGTGTLAEHWDGTSWSLQATPDPAGAGVSVLKGVSCPVARFCAAVGRYQNAAGKNVTLAETWNGTAWSIQAAPSPVGARRSYLRAVSCASPTACTATGNYETASRRHVTLAEAWNGTSWSVQPTPRLTPGRSSMLGVSCPSPGACTAVGTRIVKGKQVPLAEAWNGSSWSVQHMPSQAGGDSLSGVSCTSVNACTAVGSVIERWNGTGWSIEPVPLTGVSFSGVSCASATACIAVAATQDVAAWNGTSWSVLSNPAGTGGAHPAGVSCPSAGACAIVGYNHPPAHDIVTLAEALTGTTLSVQPTPNPAGVSYTVLAGVSCPTAAACAAVGSYFGSSGAELPLAEEWNGTRWSIKPAPLPPGASAGVLNGVSCTSPRACMAVGWYKNSAGGQDTLAETWNGTAWSLRAAPSPSAKRNALNGVSCTSASACSAVGSSRGRTLAEAWDGTAWTVRHTPNPQPASVLEAVSCTSADACTATGQSGYSTPFHTLAEAWNGTSWSIQKTPNPPGTSGYYFVLAGVSCTSASACTAVGYYFGPMGPYVTLAEAWNGTSWSIQKTPSPNPGGSTLYSVSCTSARACTAAGASSAGAPLAEAWNGTRWSARLAPVPASAGLPSAEFEGVSCLAAGPCTAVGSYANTLSIDLALAETRS
jgi:hypothetical protein